MNVSLLETYITTIGVLVTMGLLCCLCCLCMKISDLKMQRYILKTAKRKGIHIDVEKLDPKYTNQPVKDETCTIMVPDFSTIL